MAQSRVQISYSQVNVSEEPDRIHSENTDNQQRFDKKSCRSSTFSRYRINVFTTILVLVTMIVGPIAFFRSSHVSEPMNVSTKNDSVNTMILNELTKDEAVADRNASNSLEDSGHPLPQLRSDREHERHRLPYTLGHINIYMKNEDRQSYQRLRIPVARYTRHRIPFHGPFLNFMPWTSIFADRSTKQTIIHTKTNVYIIPPFIDDDDHLFSFAQLLAANYISLKSDGASLDRNIDMRRNFQERPLTGSDMPEIDSWTGTFTGRVHGNFGSFSRANNYQPVTEIIDSQEAENFYGDNDREAQENDYPRQYNNIRKSNKPKKHKKKKIPLRTRTTPSTTLSTMTTAGTTTSTTLSTVTTTGTTTSTTLSTVTTTGTTTSTTLSTVTTTGTTTSTTLSTVTATSTTTSTTLSTVTTTTTTTVSTITTTSTTTQVPVPTCSGDVEPRTPLKIIPFQNTFKNPSILDSFDKQCRSDGHCMFSYTIDVFDTKLAPFNQAVPECVSKPETTFMTYNGQIPGPMLVVPTGHESIVRFNNKMNNYFVDNISPCVGDRKGRPISVHHHGSASAPPYDGWAEDETCLDETKEYVYPNNRPATDWYHDHALHITADNAYFGLAGLYIVSSKKKHGGCGEPWNLEDIEEKFLIFQDKALDSNCQITIDPEIVDKESFYGDINLVSGIPFPVMDLEPKWYRFRMLNAAISRPYKMKIKNAAFEDISQRICKVIATDGGFRRQPVTFPTAGLLIGVAERYEIVCDFTLLKDQTLYMWNDEDEDFMKDVPYFCYSHLLAKLQVGSTAPASSPAFDETQTTPEPERTIERVLTDSDIATAMQMAQNGESHRTMVFERSGGQWVINGETWDTAKIAAEDIGHNTWEVWEFKTGGGWFHPVHIHLVDFYILERDRDGGLKDYERLSPKDIIYLGPSQNIWVLLRFGPHKGDYMFHCHNLIHEDDDMMRAFRIINTEDGLNPNTVEPFVRNDFNKIIYSNWKYADPMLTEVSPKLTSQMPILDSDYIKNMLAINVYRIFYPNSEDEPLGGFINPWKSAWCPA